MSGGTYLVRVRIRVRVRARVRARARARVGVRVRVWRHVLLRVGAEPHPCEARRREQRARQPPVVHAHLVRV